MKVESVVDVIGSYTKNYVEYTFRYNRQTEIPIGAKVTVEWDDDVHQCHDLTKRGRFSIRLEPGGWFLCSWGRESDDWRWIVVVDYCPGCGKKLGGT